MHVSLKVKFMNYHLALFSYNRIYDPLLQSSSNLYYIYHFYRCLCKQWMSKRNLCISVVCNIYFSKFVVSFFTFVWPCIITNFFIIKPNKCTNFTNLFWHEILYVSDISSLNHQEFIRCILSNGVCHTSL